MAPRAETPSALASASSRRATLSTLASASTSGCSAKAKAGAVPATLAVAAAAGAAAESATAAAMATARAGGKRRYRTTRDSASVPQGDDPVLICRVTRARDPPRDRSMTLVSHTLTSPATHDPVPRPDQSHTSELAVAISFCTAAHRLAWSSTPRPRPPTGAGVCELWCRWQRVGDASHPSLAVIGRCC